MAISLIKSLDDYTDDEKRALIEGDQGAWAMAVDGWDDQMKQLRARFLASAPDATYSADDVAIGLNYAESTRTLMHCTIRLCIDRFEHWRKSFASAVCCYCSWRHRDTTLMEISADTITDDDIVAANVRIGVALRAHVEQACPNHPMRVLEQENRALRALDGMGYL